MIDKLLDVVLDASKLKAAGKVVALCLLIGGNIVQYYRLEALQTRYEKVSAQLTAMTGAYERLNKSSKLATKYVNEQCEGLLDYWEKLLNANSKPDEEYLPKE